MAPTDAALPAVVLVVLQSSVRGAEFRQDPIRPGFLVTEAGEKPMASETSRKDAEAPRVPATALVSDFGFWQHQRHGHAVFLGGGRLGHYSARPHVQPRLPVLASDGALVVLTITADIVRPCDGSRFSLREDERADLPRSFDEVIGQNDSHDSPEDWRKARSVTYIRRIAAARTHGATDARRVVLMADAGARHPFRQLTKLGAQRAGSVKANPESMAPGPRHDCGIEHSNGCARTRMR